MELELTYNARQFEIIREHSEKDPDKIDDRKNTQYRRNQYYLLTAITAALLAASPFVPLATVIFFGALALMVTGAALVNARQRDNDGRHIAALLTHIIATFYKEKEQ